ncbi:hypothetical protein DQ04_11851010 [Trypanosoma grayi]|uniref:hypothetical protein n=1 Tax=Trypanosoma grayi TaxID=71804 RepID=UPI0004F49940|nr:hypothetical protein DQ04_11851010 [Trypanosoma grayi]KEG06870.1 hypothetical protein DQ04_11851010 [Trypanosoma grayi]
MFTFLVYVVVIYGILVAQCLASGASYSFLAFALTLVGVFFLVGVRPQVEGFIALAGIGKEVTLHHQHRHHYRRRRCCLPPLLCGARKKQWASKRAREGLVCCCNGGRDRRKVQIACTVQRGLTRAGEASQQ